MDSTLMSDQLPKTTWCIDVELYNFEGFWFRLPDLSAAMAAKPTFQARDDDVLLASSMKTGTTWLKAIIPTIMNQSNDDPLLKHHPNELIPSLELQIFKQTSNLDPSTMPSPRLFRTHLPYSMLPDSVKQSGCKTVYITRDPKDTFVSLWHFLNCLNAAKGKGPWPMDEAFEGFANGVHAFGPFHDHVLSYWKESLRRRDKIFFLRYEDMKKDAKKEVKRLASFLGRPFVKEEEVDEVLWRCSFERLKSLEVNKNGVDPWLGINNKFYFRKGMVGDWENEITQEMMERLDSVTRMKFEGTGLDFGYTN